MEDIDKKNRGRDIVIWIVAIAIVYYGWPLALIAFEWSIYALLAIGLTSMIAYLIKRIMDNDESR
jgi:hypothetical protein